MLYASLRNKIIPPLDQSMERRTAFILLNHHNIVYAGSIDIAGYLAPCLVHESELGLPKR
jgi:hypothetical protein